MIDDRTPRRPPLFLMAMTVLAVGSLLLGVINQVGQQSIQTQREIERIESDLSSCERGNDFRRQVIAVGMGADHAFTGILDLLLVRAQDEDDTPEEMAAMQALREQLDVPIGDLREAVSNIKITDCMNAIPGAQETEDE